MAPIFFQSRFSLCSITRMVGFTLAELLVVIAIVSILASIAFPSYQQYTIRSNRSAAQQTMLDIANREEQYLLNTRIYGTLTDLNATVPAQVSQYYTVTVTPNNAATPPSYTITATPLSSTRQVRDGSLSLDSLGNKTPAEKW